VSGAGLEVVVKQRLASLANELLVGELIETLVISEPTTYFLSVTPLMMPGCWSGVNILILVGCVGAAPLQIKLV